MRVQQQHNTDRRSSNTVSTEDTSVRSIRILFFKGEEILVTFHNKV